MYLNQMDSSVCNRCGAEDACYGIPPCHAAFIDGRYRVCQKCLCEWFNDGYLTMWRTLYRANNRELADKFILDFLGKLG